MTKIFFDHQTFSLQRFGGISRYFANLYKGLIQDYNFDPEIGALYTNNHYLSDHDFPLKGPVGNILMRKAKRIYKWNKWYSQYRINKGDFDVFHPTYYHPYFLNKIKKPFVLTIHDMIHELFPQYMAYNDHYAYYKRLVIAKASHLITISESTKTDLQNIYDIPDEKITVIHHGYISNLNAPVQVSPSESYILFVGERSGYKNFFNFISAIDPILEEHPEIKVICAGGGTFNSGELEFIMRQKLTTKIKQVNTSDDELRLLYQNALLFAYPSLYEGFGLPLLEAFANRCPVVASDTSCFKEVAGDAAVYFNPSDDTDIQKKVSDLIEDDDLRSRLIISGEKQLKKFSFEKCLNKTQELYNNLIQ